MNVCLFQIIINQTKLSRSFSRLFDLAENKLSIVANMFSHGWEDGGGVELEEKVVGLGGGYGGGVPEFT